MSPELRFLSKGIAAVGYAQAIPIIIALTWWVHPAAWALETVAREVRREIENNGDGK